MSNPIRIVTTRFTAYSRKRQGTQGTRIPSDTTYGVRISDDHATGFIDTWDKIPLTDLEVLELIATSEGNNSDEVNEFMNHIDETESGVTIDEHYYDWDEIKHLFRELCPICDTEMREYMKDNGTSLDEVFGCPNCDS